MSGANGRFSIARRSRAARVGQQEERMTRPPVPTIPGSNHIRAVRKSRGLTMQELADKVGVHFTTIAKLERSQRKLSAEMVHDIAVALNVEPSALLNERPERVSVRTIPIVGRISASGWKATTEDVIGHMAAPVSAPRAFALQPDGDSMDRVVGQDGMIIVDPDQQMLHDGKLYAILNEEGEATFKQYRANPPRLEPLSNNPEHKAIPLGASPFTVVGRVIWQGSAL